MKHIFYFLLFTFSSLFLSAQTEKPAYNAAAKKFESRYNRGSYDSIYTSFSAEMQKALPLKSTVDFFTGLKAQAGNIVKREFIKYESSFAVYKTKFEKKTFGIYFSINEQSMIDGLLVQPYTDDALPKPERNTTSMQLPFKGEWFIFWGGDTKEQNYHVVSTAQKNAFDIVIMDGENKTYKTNGKKNEDYYAFGKEVIAPCAGIVEKVINSVADNKPGVMNSIDVTGNSVIIKTANGEHLLLAHFKLGSILVKEGNSVKQGQLLGLCGNSGNSSEPHIHFHIMNTEDMDVATGIKCYFNKIKVNGVLKNDYSPVKGDRVGNGD